MDVCGIAEEAVAVLDYLILNIEGVFTSVNEAVAGDIDAVVLQLGDVAGVVLDLFD